MRKIKKRSNCPMSYCLDFVGDKWVLLILRDMILHKKLYFKDFLKSDEGIATNVLSDRLKMLEQRGFITSKKDALQKTMKIYSLTQQGKDVLPLLIEMLLWSSKYGDFGPEQEQLDDSAELIRADKETFIQNILNAIP
ncbi:MAG: winged helix-turn-helix transcriptional regulator [Aureispira sp.]